MSSKHVNIKDFKKELPGHLSEDHKTYLFPIVHAKNTKTGKAMTWQIIVRVGTDVTDEEINKHVKTEPNANIFIKINDNHFDSSKQLPDGQFAWTKVLSKYEDTDEYAKKTPTVTLKGLNDGKANETNAFTQALRDALGKYNKHNKNKGTEIPDDAKLTRYPPMLVKVKDPNETLDYSKGFYIQRKLNGVRVVATLDKNKVLLYSRTGNDYKGFNTIKAELKPVLEEWTAFDRPIYLDGEVYKHGTSLQEISGYARKGLQTEDGKNLEYHIYDAFIPTEPELTYEERKVIVDEIFASHKFHHIKHVETFKVHNEEEAQKYYKQFLHESYEGAILRKSWCPYRYSYNNYHSDNLLKMKPAMDDEFEIVGYTEGKNGKAKGAILFVLKTKEGKTFPVTPGLDLESRYKLFKEMSHQVDGKTVFEARYKGKFMTITFDEYSDDKIPLRTRTKGIVIRDYE